MTTDGVSDCRLPGRRQPDAEAGTPPTKKQQRAKQHHNNHHKPTKNETMTPLTIKLTGRTPISINKKEWRTIASVEEIDTHGARNPCDATRTTTTSIRVRRHADGRTIVYGSCQHESKWQGERNSIAHSGYLLEPNEDLIVAIARCAEELVAEHLMQQLINTLPPQKLD